MPDKLRPTQQHPAIEVIASRGLSQRRLARLIPCTPEFLNQVLNGHRPASARLRARISELLKLPEDSLFLPATVTSNGRPTDEFRQLVRRLVVAQRRAQGLPPKVTDPQALAHLARLVIRVERKENGKATGSQVSGRRPANQARRAS